MNENELLSVNKRPGSFVYILYSSGFLNFHDTDKQWNQPKQQTKSQLLNENQLLSVYKRPGGYVGSNHVQNSG